MGFFDFLKKQKRIEFDSKYVFDKAKYHFESVSELGLNDKQMFVHTGLFVVWLVENGLMSDFFFQETPRDIIEQTKVRKKSPSEIYQYWDGALIGDMLNEEGFNFAMSYFDFEKGTYLKDYEQMLCPGEMSIFAVGDTWENYDKLKVAINSAYGRWKK